MDVLAWFSSLPFAAQFCGWSLLLVAFVVGLFVVVTLQEER